MESSKKLSKKDFESFLIEWNNRFRYDRLWRKKYNIPFGSESHLKASQIDIYLDILEDKLIEKAQLNYIDKKKHLEEYKLTGVFLKEEILSEEDEDELFKKIRFK